MSRTAPFVSVFLLWAAVAEATGPAVASEIALPADAVAAEAAASDRGAAWARDLSFDDTRGTVVQEDRIGTLEAGLAIVAFQAGGASDKVTRQADFLLSIQGEDGGVANGAEVRGRRVVADETPRTLAAQAAAIQGFVTAHEVTGDARYLSAARKSYLFAQRELWAPQAGVYRGAEGARSTTYDAVLIGATTGALRALAEAHEGDARAEMLARIETLWTGVGVHGDPMQGVTVDTRR